MNSACESVVCNLICASTNEKDYPLLISPPKKENSGRENNDDDWLEKFRRENPDICQSYRIIPYDVESPAIVEAGEISSLSSSSEDHQCRNIEGLRWTTGSLSHRYPKISEEVVKKVIEGLEAIMELYHIYGLTRGEKITSHLERVNYQRKLDKVKISSATKMLNFLTTNGEIEWINYFKYKTLSYYAFYETEKTDLLPKLKGLEFDTPGVIFGGFVSQFIKLMRKKEPSKFSSFIVAINNSKMGLPRPTDDMIELAEDKCVNHLTNPDHLDFKLPEDKVIFERVIDLNLGFKVIGEKIVLNKENLMKQLKRTVDEMFEGVIFTEEIQYEPFYPSTSANYNKSRGKAGAVGEVYDQCLLNGTIDQFNRDDCLVDIKLVDCKLSREISTVYGKGSIEDQIRLDEDNRIETSSQALEYDVSNLKKNWRILYDRIYARAITEKPIVKAVGLSEACKVRVISKGPPMLYTALKPIQKFMWSNLKHNSVFELIGTPVLEEHINKLFGEMNPEDMIVNGDYKASTDNLHSWVSNYLAECFVDIVNKNGRESGSSYFEITAGHRQMLIRSLTGHLFEMRDGSLRPQTEGQLMGSITSFPFLCLANAAMCRWALELSNDTLYRVRDRPLTGCKNKYNIAPLKVNGDDCTMKGRRSNIRSLWEDITSFGGLTSSQGKTLFSLPHKPICVINSKTYDYNTDSKTWSLRKYINLGILLGKARSVISGQVGGKKAYSELGALHRELKHSTREELWPEVSRRFIYYNFETLRQCPHIPFDAPEYLGGPGLVPLNNEMSMRDRACASYIISKVNSKKSFDLIKRKKPDCNWKLHQCVLDRLKPFNLEPKPFKDVRKDDMIFDPMSTLYDMYIPTQECENSYSRLYKYLTIESLFTKSLDNVYDPDELFVESRHLTHNDRVWSRANSEHWSCLGLKIRETSEIMYEKKFLVVPTLETITETTQIVNND